MKDLGKSRGGTCGGCTVVFSTAEVSWRRAQDACLMLRNPFPSKIPAILIELRPAQTTTDSTATHQSPVNPPKRRSSSGWRHSAGQGLPPALPPALPISGEAAPARPSAHPPRRHDEAAPGPPASLPAASGAARGLLPYQRAPGPPAAAATSRRPLAAPAPRPWPP